MYWHYTTAASFQLKDGKEKIFIWGYKRNPFPLFNFKWASQNNPVYSSFCELSVWTVTYHEKLKVAKKDDAGNFLLRKFLNGVWVGFGGNSVKILI